MGIETFYVKIKYNKIKSMKSILEKYNECLDYSLENDDFFCISGALVSFFPAVELMYNIFSEIKEHTFTIASRNEEICYNFETYFDFLNWMYRIWQDKIDYFNKEMGAFIIKPSEYYTTRRKLWKKYYKKFDLIDYS